MIPVWVSLEAKSLRNRTYNHFMIIRSHGLTLDQFKREALESLSLLNSRVYEVMGSGDETNLVSKF